MSKNPVYTFADIEEAIVERLKWATQNDHGTLKAWCRKVGNTYDQEAIGQTAPAIYLNYEGFSVLDKNHLQTMEGHRWLIALVIKDAGAQRYSAKFNKQIGIYQHQIKAALKGFMP